MTGVSARDAVRERVLLLNAGIVMVVEWFASVRCREVARCDVCP